MTPVGFWARFGATLLDTLLLFALITPLMLLFYDAEALLRPTLVRGPVDFFVSWVAPVAATLLFWRYRSATPGKMMIGAVIVDSDSLGAPAMRQLVIRYFAYLASILPLGLGFLWIVWDPRKQAFHDKIANTLVVYKPSLPAGRLPGGSLPAGPGKVRTPRRARRV